MKQVLVTLKKNAYRENNNFLITGYTGLPGSRLCESLVLQKSKVNGFSFDLWFRQTIEWYAYFFEYYNR